jgi:VWFA-related protein
VTARRLLSAILFAGCLVRSARPYAGQPASQHPTFRAATDVVEVDAVVTDRSGAPVRNLTRNDFHVFEDGQPRTIASLSLVSLPAPATTAPVAPVTDIVTNEGSFTGRLYAIVIDDLHTDPARAAGLRTTARRFVERYLGANDLMAVLHTSDARAANAAFTGDKSLLIAAIDRTTGRAAAPEADPYANDAIRGADARATLAAVQRAAAWLERIPNRRKALLFIGAGIDYDVTDVVPDQAATALGNIAPGASTPSTEWAGVVNAAMRDAVNAAMRANVAVYGIDPNGLAGNRLGQDSLRTLSSETGGVAIVNRNGFDGAFQQIVDDTSTYYVLTFTRGTEPADGRFHRIDVRVDRPGVTVRARQGYVAPAKQKAAATPTDDSAWVRSTLGSPIPLSTLPLRLFAAPFKGQQEDASVLLGVEIDGRDLNLVAADRIQVAYEAIPASGEPADAHVETIVLNPSSKTKAQMERDGVRFLQRAALTPGRYQLRVAVRDGDGRLGSVSTSLTVPDFGRAPLALSGIVLTSTSASRTVTAQADDLLHAALPAAPAALRVFPRTDAVAMYAEAYENGNGTPARVDLTTTIESADGRVLVNGTQSRTSAEIAAAGHRAVFPAAVPIRQLEPGSYVLTVTARSGAADIAPATQRIPFSVTPAPSATSTVSSSAVPSPQPCCPDNAAYVDDVRAFAHGDRTLASIAIARAPANELRRAVAALADHDTALLETAAGLHLALALRAADVSDLDKLALHLHASDTAFEKMRDAVSPSFAADWYIAAVELSLAAGDPRSAIAIAQRGVEENIAPAAAHFAEGIARETTADVSGRLPQVSSPANKGLCRTCPPPAGTRIGQTQIDLGWTSTTMRAAELDEAENAYRQALQDGAVSEEARLRLGRVLLLKHKDADARAEFETLVKATDDSRLLYLAHLFLAGVALHGHDAGTAAREYAAAIDAAPSARTPYVGLSNLMLLAGDSRAAEKRIHDWRSRSPSSGDPWTTYRAGLDQLESSVQALLEMISR